MKKLIQIIKAFIYIFLPVSFYKKIDYLNRRYFLKSFSSYGLDKKMNKYLKKDAGYYIEMGANDGIEYSNTYLLELSKKWKGVLVEPNLNNFFECIKNRSNKNIFFCNACVSFDYKEKFVPMIYADLMTMAKKSERGYDELTHLEESSTNHLQKNERITEYGSIAKTLTEILHEANAPKNIDFFSLDVEGTELDVLKGIDFNEYNIEYILTESNSLDIEYIVNFLTSKNYVLLEKLSPVDFLFGLKT